MTAEHTAELTAPLFEPISVRGMTIPNRTITAVRRARGSRAAGLRAVVQDVHLAGDLIRSAAVHQGMLHGGGTPDQAVESLRPSGTIGTTRFHELRSTLHRASLGTHADYDRGADRRCHRPLRAFRTQRGRARLQVEQLRRAHHP